MIILGVECSAVSAGAAVIKDGKLVSESFVNCGLTHSETLLPMIDKALSDAKITLEDVDTIAVSNGPGSFTGLRIGVATVKGLAMGAEKPVCGVSSLYALCFNVPCAQGVIVPMMDARREQVYCAVYERKGETLTEVMPMCAMALSELLEKVKDGATFVGDGAAVFYDKIKDVMGDKALFPSENLIYQRASSIATAAQYVDKIDEKQLESIYLRMPQAERERLEKERK